MKVKFVIFDVQHERQDSFLEQCQKNIVIENYWSITKISIKKSDVNKNFRLAIRESDSFLTRLSNKFVLT